MRAEPGLFQTGLCYNQLTLPPICLPRSDCALMGAMPQDPFIREKFTRDMLTIDAAIHDAVMALPPDERRDRAKVNEAVRNGPQTWAVAPCRK